MYIQNANNDNFINTFSATLKSSFIVYVFILVNVYWNLNIPANNSIDNQVTQPNSTDNPSPKRGSNDKILTKEFLLVSMLLIDSIMIYLMLKNIVTKVVAH